MPLLAVLLYAKSNMVGDAPIFLVFRPTVLLSVSTAELNSTMDSNAMTQISQLVMVTVPSV